MREPSPLRDRPDDRADAPEIDRRSSRPTPPAPRQSPPDDEAPPQRSPKRSRRPLYILGFVVLVAAIAGGAHFWMTRNEVSTDDAYTDGNAVTVAPQVSGNVVKLAVNDNQFVHAGDLLIQIDPRLYQAARDQAAGALEVAQAQLANAQQAYAKAQVDFPAQLQAAEAQLASARANQVNAQSDFRRQHDIAAAATTQQNVDRATATLRQAEAQVQQAQAQLAQAQLVAENIAQAAAQVKQLEGQVLQARAELDRAEINLSYTRVTAPQDGWVTERNVNPGNYVQPGAAILSLVPAQVWVTANFKETQLARLRPGQPVAISVDAYPDLRLTGHVDSVQMGSGSKFTAFPAENATGNYVKIVQRVPVKIDIDSGLAAGQGLPLGISVTPTVTVP
jgi:membrane fusion protein (multidrug efflux system)